MERTSVGARWPADFPGRRPMKRLMLAAAFGALALGACSDPHMQWQLELELIFADGEKRILKQQFQSSWR